MKEIVFNKYKYRKIEIWFCNNRDLNLNFYENVDLVEFKESHYKFKKYFLEFRNGIKNLTLSKSQIFSSLDNKFRYEVGRAQRESMFCQALQVDNFDLFNDIYEMYVKFSHTKKIDFIKKGILKKYIENDSLYITYATLKRTDIILQYHIYFKNLNEAVLLASFLNLNVFENIESKFFGWANRLLHWEDMLFFKENNVRIYNLGGMGNPPSARNKNIIKFKAEMNPEIKTYYYGLIPISWKAKIYFGLKKFLKR